MNRKQNELSLEEISPHSHSWPLFLRLCAKYLLETWPKNFPGQTPESVAQEYNLLLLERIKEGGRHLFLLFCKDQPVGLANVYFQQGNIPHSERVASILHIAEFGIIPESRKKGLGSFMLNALLNYAEKNKAEEVRVEVDKENKVALTFWKSHFPDFSTWESRITFWKIL